MHVAGVRCRRVNRLSQGEEDNSCCDKWFATWLKTKIVIDSKGKHFLDYVINSCPTSLLPVSGLEGVVHFTILIFNSSSFFPQHRLPLPASLCFWRHGHTRPPPPTPQQLRQLHRVTTLPVRCGAYSNAIKPLPGESVTRRFELRANTKRGPFEKEPSPAWRRSEGCLQNNSLLSAACFPRGVSSTNR